MLIVIDYKSIFNEQTIYLSNINQCLGIFSRNNYRDSNDNKNSNYDKQNSDQQYLNQKNFLFRENFVRILKMQIKRRF